MSLLVFDRVTMRYPRGEGGTRERVPVRDASLAIEPGEFVALVGRGRSGRTSVLRLAGGMEPPTEGVVRFDGQDLRQRRFLGKPGGIGFCLPRFSPVSGRTVLDHVGTGLLGLKHKEEAAAASAEEALERVGAGECADMDPEALEFGETVRVRIAKALVAGPRLLLVDDPLYGVELDERDDLLLLLQSLAHGDGIAVFITVGSGTGLAGVDRAISIDGGQLRGKLRPAPRAEVRHLHGEVRPRHRDGTQ